MKILFSPLGNTDPWRNDRDGAMLHITRHYQPDVVFLFATKSIWEGNERFEGHVHYNWEEIIHSVRSETKVLIEVLDIKDEHDFDSYKEIFHFQIKELEKAFPNSEILLNVTSGTPQMESTLCLEYITYPNNKKCIQVSSPLATSNAKTKYAVPEDQEIDLTIVNDEEKNMMSRCKEIQIISFRETMVRNQVIKLLENYDYEAALSLVTQQSDFRNKGIIKKDLLEVTEAIKNHRAFLPLAEKYKFNQDLKKALFHYLLLEMRFRRRDHAEVLIRVKTIAEFISEKYLRKKYPNIFILQGKKLILNLNYAEGFGEVYNKYLIKNGYTYKEDQFLNLPTFYNLLDVLEPDGEFRKSVNQVMEVNNLRNSVAHNLDQLDIASEENEKKLVESVRAVKKMLNLAYPKVEQEDFNFFKKFNERVIKLL